MAERKKTRNADRDIVSDDMRTALSVIVERDGRISQSALVHELPFDRIKAEYVIDSLQSYKFVYLERAGSANAQTVVLADRGKKWAVDEGLAT